MLLVSALRHLSHDCRSRPLVLRGAFGMDDPLAVEPADDDDEILVAKARQARHRRQWDQASADRRATARARVRTSSRGQRHQRAPRYEDAATTGGESLRHRIGDSELAQATLDPCVRRGSRVRRIARNRTSTPHRVGLARGRRLSSQHARLLGQSGFGQRTARKSSALGDPFAGSITAASTFAAVSRAFASGC